MTTTFRRALLDRATQPYRSAGNFAWHFARGKLKDDPAFFGLLEHCLIPDAERLIDLGCGQGLLASWPLEARTLHESGDWPAQWPAAPKVEHIWGLELMQEDVLRRIRAALPPGGTFITRIGDAASGLPFRYSNGVDRTVFFLRGHGIIPLYCRTTAEWLIALKRCGFEARSMPMHEGTPFKNVMLIAKAL